MTGITSGAAVYPPHLKKPATLTEALAWLRRDETGLEHPALSIAMGALESTLNGCDAIAQNEILHKLWLTLCAAEYLCAFDNPSATHKAARLTEVSHLLKGADTYWMARAQRAFNPVQKKVD